MKKRFGCAGVLLLLFLFVGSVPASALPAYGLEATDPSLLPQYADFLLEDFESTESLTVSPNVTAFQATEETDFAPYLPVSGRRMAEGRAAFLAVGEECFVEKEFDIHADLTLYNYLFCYISCQTAGDSLIPVRLTLITDKGDFDYDALLTPGVGNTLAANLLELTGDTVIEGARILFRNDGTHPLTDFRFSLDSLGLSLSGDLPSSLRFLSDYFTVSAGGDVKKEEDSYAFRLSGSDPYFQTGGFLSTSRKNRIEFSSDIDFDGVDVYYTTPASPVFSRDRKVEAILYGDTLCSAVFELPGEEIGEIRVVFRGGEGEGNVTLYAIEPLSVYTPIASGLGKVTSCLIAGSKEDAVLVGRLDESAVAGGRLMLYELSAFEDEQSAPLLTYTPLAVTEASEEFTFRFPLVSEGGQSRLFSKFLVVYSDGRQLTLLDNAKYLSNPGAVAETAVVRPDTTQKGFSSLTRSELIARSASALSFDIECEKLITLGASRYSVTVDGESVYFAERYVEELDRLVKSFDGIGCEAVARLTVKSAGDERIDRLLLHPDFDPSSTYGAFNVTDRQGLTYFLAICDFLVTRYNGGEQGLIGRYILGDRVDGWGERYSVGKGGIDVFAKAYATALRLLCLTAESRGLSDAVFASLSGDVFSFVPSGTRMRTDALTLLSYLQDMTDATTPFAFGVSADPFDIREKEGYEAFLDAIRPFGRTLIVDEHTKNTAPLTEQEVSSRYAENYWLFASEENLLYYITDSRGLNARLALYIDSSLSKEAVSEYLREETAAVFPLEGSRLLLEHTAQSSLPFAETGRFRLFDFTVGSGLFAAGENLRLVEGGQNLLGREGLLTFTPLGQGSIQAVLASPLDLSLSPAVAFEASVASLPAETEAARLRVTFHAGKDRAVFDGTVTLGEWTPFVCDLSGFGRANAIDRVTVELRSADGLALGEPLAVLSGFDVVSPSLSGEELLTLFTPDDGQEDTPFLSKDNTLLVWSLILAAVFSFSLLMMRFGAGRRDD